MSETEFNRTIAHAQSALINVQANIRFIDTKVAGALAAMAATLGLSISRGVLLRQIKDWSANGGWLGWVEVGLCVLCVLAFLLAVYYSFKTLIPRKSTNPLLVDKSWLLFPCVPQDKEVVLHKEISDHLSMGYKMEEVLQEYADQLSVLGGINESKMTSSKALIFSALSFCLLVLAVASISFIKEVL